MNDKYERQKSGFDFEKTVEQLFENISRDNKKKEYTGEYDAELTYNNQITPCQIKHTTNQNKKYIEMGDLKRNYEKQDNYYLITGYDTKCNNSDIKIHFKNHTQLVSNNSDIHIGEIYVYYINPKDFNIDYSIIEELNNLNVDNNYTKCMNVNEDTCDYNDKTIFKHGIKTLCRAIYKLYMKKDILSYYNFYNKIDRNLYKVIDGFVVYEVKDGFVTHIPVDDNGEPYKNINDIPYEYSAILKIDNTLLTDHNWKIVRKYITTEFKKNNNIVKFNPKRDHRNQFRFQCSIEKKYIEEYKCEFDEYKFKLNNLLNFN